MIGNSNLSNEKLNEILSTCPNIVVLSLRNLTELTSIGFVSSMSHLKELDLLGCTNLNDLEILDTLRTEKKIDLKTLRINNGNIDLSKIQTTISNLDWSYKPGSDGFYCTWAGASGFYATGAVWKNLKNCNKITTILSCGDWSRSSELLGEDTIDLTGCTSLKSLSLCYYTGGHFSLPINLQELHLNVRSTDIIFEFPKDSKLTVFDVTNDEGGLTNENFGNLINSLKNCSNLKNLELTHANNGSIGRLSSLSGIEQLNQNLGKIVVRDFNSINDIGELGNFYNLENLELSNCAIPDISKLKITDKETETVGLKKLRTLNLSKNNIIDASVLKDYVWLETLNLNTNKIINLSFLSNLLKLGDLNLQNNLIEDTAQEGSDKINNLDVLVKLHNSGILRKLRISDNLIIDLSKIQALDWVEKDF